MQLRILHHFVGSDGAGPTAPLLFFRGALYGTTSSGGKFGLGTIFRLSNLAASPTFSVLHNFSGTDGADPEARLIAINGLLFGTTYAGGKNDRGTVFRIAPHGTGFTSLYSFGANPDGSNPKGDLAFAYGDLWGTTYRGGVRGNDCSTAGCGTVFRMPLNGKVTIVSRFAGGADGFRPAGGVLASSDGSLWGTTLVGGVEMERPTECAYDSKLRGCGTLFRLVKTGHHFTRQVINKFRPGAGIFPNGGLAQSLFSVTPSGTGFVVNVFRQSDVAAIGDLALSKGSLFGTVYPGAAGNGSVYSNLGGTYTELYRFTGGSDGAKPLGGVVAARGILFGATSEGGGACTISGSGCGTIFALPMP